jgi:repressor LexA
MHALTRKQREILDFLLQNQDAFAHPPSLQELCTALGLKSRGS